MSSELAEGWTHDMPLNGAARGRLIFPRGMPPDVSVSAAPLGDRLLVARFERPVPALHARGEDVLVEYEGGLRSFLSWHARAAAIQLNAEIPWQIRVDHGASRASLDLSAADVRGVEIRGGASRVSIELGEPRERVAVRFVGSVSGITISRPAAVDVGLAVTGGASRTRLDDETVAAASGLALQARGGGAVGGGYDIRVEGSSSGLSVLRRS